MHPLGTLTQNIVSVAVSATRLQHLHMLRVYLCLVALLLHFHVVLLLVELQKALIYHFVMQVVLRNSFRTLTDRCRFFSLL